MSNQNQEKQENCIFYADEWLDLISGYRTRTVKPLLANNLSSFIEDGCKRVHNVDVCYGCESGDCDCDETRDLNTFYSGIEA